MERVDSIQHIGVNITEGLTLGMHINSVVRQARQRMFHFRHLMKFWVPFKKTREFLLLHHQEHPGGEHHCPIQKQYQTGTQDPSRSSYVVVRSDEHTIDSALHQMKNEARRNIKDPNYQDYLFSLLQSGRRYQIHQASNERLREQLLPSGH